MSLRVRIFAPRALQGRVLPVAFAIFMASALVATEDTAALPDGTGRDAVEAACTVCHTVDRIVRQKLTTDQWRGTLREMIENGASLNPDQWEPVIAYLAKNFGPVAKSVNVNTGSAQELSAGLQLTTAEADAIVVYRKVNGPFRDVTDLGKVQGVDWKKIEGQKERISF